MQTAHTPRVAILGISLESNSFAPVTTKDYFEAYAYCLGDEILTSKTINYWIGCDKTGGFVGRLNSLRAWEPVPILIADGQSGGPCDHGVYTEISNEMLNRLRNAMPVNAVYIVAHGAGTTTELDDLDGHYFQAVRDIVGPEIPIVATLDLHGNISDLMAEAADVLISQQTNPHIDSLERAEDAATILHAMLNGERYHTALIRLPLVTPQVSQLTAAGTPYGDIMATAQAMIDDTVKGVSVLSGFAFSDTPYNGMVIYAFGLELATVEDCVHKLAQEAWGNRERFTPNLTSIDEAVRLTRMQQAIKTPYPVILADVADNPGGGGTGDTLWLLRRFYEEGLENIYIGVIHDPDLVKAATAAGTGNTFQACFNQHKSTHYSEKYKVSATVQCLKSGDYWSTTGIYSGSVVPLGPSCVLKIGGLSVIIVSNRQQLLGYDCFAHFGLDVMQASAVIVKSRGHFRASFEKLVPPENIFEVDAPGLTTPNLSTVQWKNLPCPIYPLDADTVWSRCTELSEKSHEIK